MGNCCAGGDDENLLANDGNVHKYGTADQAYQKSAMTPAVDITSPVICRVIAMYDFDARDETELGFKEDDVIDVLNKDDADWWVGRLNGRIGEFPGNRTAMLSSSGSVLGSYASDAGAGSAGQ